MSNINTSDIKVSNNHLLVKCETTSQNQLKDLLCQSFVKFEQKFGVDCSAVKREIERHGLFMTNSRFYFLYNSKLSFMQKFRSKREDVLKLLDFYNSFNPERTSFWTITRKTFKLENIFFKQYKNRTKVEFEEINQAENNLRSLLRRLEAYGYHITKYILVLEIKEKDGLFNYHFHGIFEVDVDILKIRANKKERFRDLVFNKNFNRDMDNGWISFPILSDIWKEISKDDSYRIKREPIRKKLGVFHYVLSYMNKGIEYQNVKAVPYLYFALKSKKSYRLKGAGKIPKIKYRVLDNNRNNIFFDYFSTRWINEEEIPIDKQDYILQLFKDDNLLEEKKIIQYFKGVEKRIIKDNYLLSNFDKKLLKNRLVFKKKYNWPDVEKEFSKSEIQKLLTEGYIFDTKEGYMLL